MIFEGLYLSRPGIENLKNWKFFKSIIPNLSDNKISIKALIEVFLSYLVKSKIKNMPKKNNKRSG